MSMLAINWLDQRMLVSLQQQGTQLRLPNLSLPKLYQILRSALLLSRVASTAVSGSYSKTKAASNK